MLTKLSTAATCISHLSDRYSLPPGHVTQNREYSESCKEAGAAVSCGDNYCVPKIRTSACYYKNLSMDIGVQLTHLMTLLSNLL